MMEAHPLPTGSSTQKAGLIFLTRAFLLAPYKKANICTYSKYDFATLHVNEAIHNEMGILTTGEKINYKEEILHLLHAIRALRKVAVIHFKIEIVEAEGNQKAGREAR